MKYIKYSIVWILIVILIIPITCFAESDDVITYDEAWELLEKAQSLSVFVNGGGGWVECKYDLHTLTNDYVEYRPGENDGLYIYGNQAKETINEYAKGIYTTQYVDGSWKVDYRRNDNVSAFNATKEERDAGFLNGIWTVFPVDNAYVLKSEENFPHFGCLERFTFITNGAGRATAEVLLIKDPGSWARQTPVNVSVEFTHTESGWRISGGEFVNAMCNTTKTKYTVVALSSGDFLETEELLYNIKQSVTGDGKIFETLNKNSTQYTFVSKTHIKYVVDISFTTSSGISKTGKYTAFFKYISGDEYKKLPAEACWPYYPEGYPPAKSSDDYGGPYLVFYGGSLYDLLVNGNLDAETFHGEASAYTGDDIQQSDIYFWSISAALSVIAGAWLVIHKKRATI